VASSSDRAGLEERLPRSALEENQMNQDRAMKVTHSTKPSPSMRNA
jgi:hypothetical protein